jgi:hypothetical protein
VHCSDSSTADHALQVQRLHTSTGVSCTSEPVNQFPIDHATGGLRRAQHQEWPGNSGLRAAGARGQQRVAAACGKRSAVRAAGGFPVFPGRRSVAEGLQQARVMSRPGRQIQRSRHLLPAPAVCGASSRRSAAQRGGKSAARADDGLRNSVADGL